MISNWNVIQAVASRYGDREDTFIRDKERIDLARQGQIPLTELETNEKRLKLRMARNDSVTTFLLERVNGVPDFQDTYILDMLTDLAASVVRITKNGSPLGTGFLVGDDVIITNHHVIGSADETKGMLAEFDFELDRQMIPKRSSSFRLNPTKFFLTSSLDVQQNVPFSGLDFTLVALDPLGINGEQLAQKFKPIFLDGNLGKIIKGESCVIIQHPSGLPKKIVLKDTAFFSESGTRMVYETDTLPGSSGSMVVALGTGTIVALHHAGLPRTDEQNRVLTKTGQLANSQTPDNEIDWIGNEGIKVSCIIDAIRQARLTPEMETRRQNLLNKTKAMAEMLNSATSNTAQNISHLTTIPSSTHESNIATPMNTGTANTPDTFSGPADFLVTAVNKPEAIQQINNVLQAKYGSSATLALAMPASAMAGQIELFALTLPIQGNLNEAAEALCQIPGIINAEPDVPLVLNTGPSTGTKIEGNRATESAGGKQIFGTPNEDEFLDKYTRKQKSRYIEKEESAFERNRKWNWTATKFDQISDLIKGLDMNVRIVQFDTGYTDHPKVEGGFDFDHDHNFVDNTDNAADAMETGLLRQPGHGTRTGSLIIGKELTAITGNGNCGLLASFQYKLTPFRISSSVILIKRQKELAAALDSALAQGFDIITMSMGLPPTIATAKMAKKAYDKGVIWCCAAGNEIQAVVAPAVYPGTIAVAASNPMDSDWPGSSRGDAVDITAPGQDVYVPILVAENEYGFSYGNGTSYATPHVAAAAALWLAKYKTILNDPKYGGWKRVEAFRMALKDSANRDNNLPRKGFGHGMLDVKKLLDTPPTKNELEYAYNNWDENAFFAALQGVGQIGKTLWNRLHGLIFGTARGGQESLMPESMSLSPTGTDIERALFGTHTSQFESAADGGQDLLERFNIVQNMILSASKK